MNESNESVQKSNEVSQVEDFLQNPKIKELIEKTAQNIADTKAQSIREDYKQRGERSAQKKLIETFAPVLEVNTNISYEEFIELIKDKLQSSLSKKTDNEKVKFQKMIESMQKEIDELRNAAKRAKMQERIKSALDATDLVPSARELFFEIFLNRAEFDEELNRVFVRSEKDLITLEEAIEKELQKRPDLRKPSESAGGGSGAWEPNKRGGVGGLTVEMIEQNIAAGTHAAKLRDAEYRKQAIEILKQKVKKGG